VGESIQSKLNPKLCIKASASTAAVLAPCAEATKFAFPSKYPGQITATVSTAGKGLAVGGGAKDGRTVCLAVKTSKGGLKGGRKANLPFPEDELPLTDWEATGEWAINRLNRVVRRVDWAFNRLNRVVRRGEWAINRLNRVVRRVDWAINRLNRVGRRGELAINRLVDEVGGLQVQQLYSLWTSAY
jgi:hypothetical protein